MWKDLIVFLGLLLNGSLGLMGESRKLSSCTAKRFDVEKNLI